LVVFTDEPDGQHMDKVIRQNGLYDFRTIFIF